MAPLTRAAFPTGFREPRKIATQVKMRQKKRKCIEWSESFFIYFFILFPPEPPALQGLLAASLSFAWGTRLSARVGLMPCTMRVAQGKVQRNPLWLLGEKVTVIFHWSAAETGNLTQGPYQCGGRASTGWDFHQNQKAWNTFGPPHNTFLCQGPLCLVLLWLNSSLGVKPRGAS